MTMVFLQIAYKRGWIDSDMLKLAVKTVENPKGVLTVEQYKQITGEEF